MNRTLLFRSVLAVGALTALFAYLPAQEPTTTTTTPPANAATTAAAAVGEIVGLKHPAISPDEKEIAFSYRGDIWMAPIAGGDAIRVTRDESACAEHPVFLPTAHGMVLAFTGDERHSQDIFLTTRDGHRRLRLTAHGADDARPAFSPDGKWLYFQSRRDSNVDLVANESIWDVWRIPTIGGTAMRVTYFGGQTPAVNADGSRIAFSRYGSGYADGEHDIHIVGAAGGVPKTVASARADQRLPQFAGRHLYFISNANGVHHNTPADNVWGMPAEGGAHHQITNFRSGQIKGFAVAQSGQFAVIERDFRLYRVEMATGTVTPIVVRIAGDNPYASRQAEMVPASVPGSIAETAIRRVSDTSTELLVRFGDYLRTLTVPAARMAGHFDSPNGDDRVAPLEMRAPDFTLDGTNPQWPETSPDGRWLAVCEGESDGQAGTRISLYDLTGNEPRRTLAEGGAYRNLAFSADGTRVAWSVRTDDGGRIDELDLSAGTVRELIAAPGDRAIALYLQYLPGQAMAYVVSRPGNRSYTSTIWIRRGGAEAQPLALEHEGLIRHMQVSPDGAHLVFAAPRNRREQLAVVNIAAQTVRWLDAPVDCAYPRWQSSTELIAAATSRTAQGIVRFDLATDGAEPQRAFFPIDTNRRLARAELHAQTFEEMWTQFRDRFYDPFTHGVNWAERGEFYRPLANQATSTRELYDLMSRLILELDSSHVHVAMPGRPVPRTGMPGWDVAPLADGTLTVRDVLANGPAAQSGIKAGEIIVAIDGVPLGPRVNADELLTGPLLAPSDAPGAGALLAGGGRVAPSVPDPNWTCELVVRNSAGEQRQVRCALLTRTQIRQVRYANLIEWRREFVNRRSNGRLAYHHIQTMLGADLREFLDAVPRYKSQSAEALVLDIRDGIGGNIHHALATALDSAVPDRLRDRPACYIRGRGRNSTPDGIGGPYYFDVQMMRQFSGRTWDRPSICVMNNICRSDKEIFPHLYRHMGLGTLIGEPTARGVIGSGYVDLPDGGTCMMSMNVFFTADGTNMEGNAVEPDVLVPETLADLYAGRDRQLEVAVDYLLAQLTGALSFPEKHSRRSMPSLDAPAVPRQFQPAEKSPGEPGE